MIKEEILKELTKRFTIESKDSEDVWFKSSSGQVFKDPYIYEELMLFLKENLSTHE